MASTLEAVRQQAELHGETRVSRIVLRIGTLAGVDPVALRFAFDALHPGTVAADAVLDLEAVPARARCGPCARAFAAEPGFIFRCPTCGEYSGDLLAGRELGIARLEFS